MSGQRHEGATPLPDADASIRVLTGNPDDDELAAVIAVLSAAAAEQPAAPPEVDIPRSAWELSQRPLRSWSPDARWR
ncbi:acyl-CoA carboxylase subunit epsilon [Herbiconiux sp. L3-i23]|uniref:acyl-CoA carboxylase subunit epsilon n=1 Tax=Herbiconiux sp. L3-i23 TaxID=2905871 RepID=UPI002055D545|nr:acyl-CoA carboxylase subunit epsilon [Herbiconiux sp. L3-i23]BDI21595.1 hypothetical protein L3i23_03710 [Herbiconiux sp. L3-i23]